MSSELIKPWFTKTKSLISYRTAHVELRNESGAEVISARDVEVPDFWSDRAALIMTTKYLNEKVKETGARDLFNRVCATLTSWGSEDGTLQTFEEMQLFQEELMHILVTQRASFNSPVYFNMGLQKDPFCHACFILAIEDNLESIFTWIRDEGMIFSNGSGAGVNLSSLRAKHEKLSGGRGTASGPLSFMQTADVSAGIIKSAGRVRRAAKMVVLDVDHPDIEDFIWCKVKEEDKMRALLKAGYSDGLDGEARMSVCYQNANNSVRVTDEFMQAVESGETHFLYDRVDDRLHDSVPARQLFHEMCEAAWKCGDPGLQFDDAIQYMHTSPGAGRISSSNPCCVVGETRMNTSRGCIRFDILERMSSVGASLPYSFSYDPLTGLGVSAQIRKVWVSGYTQQLVEVRTEKGIVLQCTPEHKWLLYSRDYVAAADLEPGTSLACWPGVAIDWVISVTPIVLDEPVPVYDAEIDGVHNFTVSMPGFRHAVVLHNSEYLHLDNSACNLASLNLIKFIDPTTDEFLIDDFCRTVDVMITAMDIIVTHSGYPTEKIKQTVLEQRELGLGYANLGAALMVQGIPYDSDKGREWAASVTSLMGAEAYKQSIRLGRRLGPVDGLETQAMQNVIDAHVESATELDKLSDHGSVTAAAKNRWESISRHVADIRNTQVTCIAPTGTIALLMDCDTTGCEPMIALKAEKSLVGGGSIKLDNRLISQALKKRGYSDRTIQHAMQCIAEHRTLESCINENDMPVFATAFGQSNTLSPMAHVRMVAAIQPFVSGGVSKTVNLPESATVEDIEEIYLKSWKLGLKSVSVYRNGCKMIQPVKDAADLQPTIILPAAKLVPSSHRHKLPPTRKGKTHKIDIAGFEGYLTTGEYEDGTLGEIFLNFSRQGSTMAGLADTFATAFSFALQYGVPLQFLVDKFKGARFEPAGFSKDERIKYAFSVIDYVARWLELEYLAPAVKSIERTIEITKFAPPSVIQNIASPIDGPICRICGSIMVVNGTCWLCTTCGATTGC